MTTLYSRSPLQLLSMSTSQRPATRRKTRHTFDDEEEPPAKKSKIDNAANANGVSKTAPAKSNGAAKKRSKTAYDEDADGFQFTRKTRSAKPAAQPEAATSSEAPPAAARSKRKKDSFVVSPAVEEETGQKRRRSKRLSAENEPKAASQPEPKPKRKRKSDEPKPAQVERESSPRSGGGSLSVAKKHDGTKIALPFADTPVIKRNKEMREKSKSKHRRSSTGLRGRRASSLIDSGTSNAVPHADVDSRDFYKHIEQSLPEPRRMKQLLTWNGTRMLPEKVNGGAGDASETFAVDGARHMMEELLKDWANKSEMSDWFHREDVQGSTAVVKNPNPHNERMAAKVKELEEDVRRLQEEKKTWEALRKDNSATAEPTSSNTSDEIDSSLLYPEQAKILATLQTSSHPDSADISARLQKISVSLEPQVDLFADGIHKISQYRQQAERVADKILSSTATRLEKRDREAREASGTTGVGAREVLSALGGALSDQR
ncbi:hypothetical protein EJ08DRAFT_609293 [Tothia fuscella]|uniref:Kinetochore protein mis13 n=1 Tax=Tothia fuscella TaxID=1048955 RepID=A0A9P4NWH4_9PEZI|nr:hypothetical protein EJ08DRAFT_609293 [Tothia fuscella]